MKKSILALGIILMAGVSTYAQDMNSTPAANTMKVTLGPTVSFGHSFISNMNGNVWKPSGGLGVSILAAKEYWGVGANLSASHEGYKRQFQGVGAQYRETIDPTYLRFTPAFYAFPGHFTTHVKPMLYLGPSVARKMTEDHYMSNISANEQDNQHFVTDNKVKEWDFGAVGGVGVNAQVGANTWLNVDANYYHGFFDVMNGNENRNVRVNLGLMFGL